KASTDCQKPQYQAEKTTASQATLYGLWSPRRGTSALRSSSAARAARIASTYRKTIWLGSAGREGSKTSCHLLSFGVLGFDIPTAAPTPSLKAIRFKEEGPCPFLQKYTPKWFEIQLM